MRVLFATPPWRFSEIYPASMARDHGVAGDRLGTITGVTEPLGMLGLAAALRERGHRPEILDGYGLTDEAWFARIRAARPELLGLTLSAFSWDKARPRLSAIKQSLPATPIVVGGPYPTGRGPACLAEMPEADFAVRGAGEHALLALCAALETGTAVPPIPGLMRREAGGAIETPPDPAPAVDELPFPARDLVDMSRYRPSVGFYNRLPSASIITARGCPRRCRFCVSGKQTAFRSAGRVLAEIAECVQRYRTRHVVFWDEDIAIKRSHAEALCEGLLQAGAPVSWCASLCLDRVVPELIALMKRAGCWKLLFGLESGVDEVVRSLDKTPLPPAEIAAKLRTVSRAGIETYATFMFGIPGETRAMAERTISLAARLPLDYALFLNFTPFPGTPYFPEMERHGRFQGIWSTQAISFVPHTMTADDLRALRVAAYRRFYLRPSYVWRRLRKMRTREDWSRNFRGLIAALGLRKQGLV